MNDRVHVPIPTLRRFSAAQIERALDAIGPLPYEWEPDPELTWNCKTGLRLDAVSQAANTAWWRAHLAQQKQESPASGVLPMKKRSG